ncbi:MAG TPA: condensation domain-containing protein, partial [Polyangiales bacterium]|nr:condensation domain-containing protein [Polyangiales bacterium]
MIAEVLELPQVGRHDDFFALGGDSIRSLQVISRARKLGVVLRPRDLFEARSVAELAKVAGTLQPQASELVRLPRDTDLFPLSYAQERMWFLAQLEPESSAYNIASALRLHGELDFAALQRALDALVARHEVLRTGFEMHDGVPLQRVHAPRAVNIARVDARSELPQQAEDKARALTEEQAHQPFDLTCAPLMRVAVTQLPGAQQVLSVVVHHIVSDGWSMDVAISELFALYAAAMSGADLDAALPALPAQYVDYAAWQKRWLEGPERARQLAYWTAELGDEHPVLSLPVDHPRRGAEAFGAVLERELDSELGTALQALAQAQGVSMFMLLLAAWQTLLSRLSGQRDIRVGVPVTNRSRIETEQLIGLFVNTQVLRSQVSGDQRFSALLQAVK